MVRVVCRAYQTGVFAGVEFREAVLDGALVGVATIPRNHPSLAWFERRPQFSVEWGDEPPPPPPVPAATVDLSGLTVAELRAYAAENDVDLGGATRKADILKALQ